MNVPNKPRGINSLNNDETRINIHGLDSINRNSLINNFLETTNDCFVNFHHNSTACRTLLSVTEWL